MSNEWLFFLQSFLIGSSVIIAFWFKKEGLISFTALAGVLANLFVAKQIQLFGLAVTASDAYMIGASLSLNVLQEFYGRATTRKTIWIAFYCQILFMIVSLIHCTYIPNKFDISQSHYCAILSNLPRLIAGSLFSYNAAEWTNYGIFIVLKKIWATKWFALRSFIATSTAQGVDTILFSILGLHGIVGSVWDIILMSFAIKISILCLTIPFLTLLKRVST